MHSQALQIKEDKRSKADNVVQPSQNLSAFQKALEQHGLLGPGASNSSFTPANATESYLQPDAPQTSSLSASSLQANVAQRRVISSSLPASSLQSDVARMNVNSNASTRCLGGYTPDEAGILECPEGFADSQVQKLSRWFPLARLVLIFWAMAFALMSALLVEMLRRVRSKSSPRQNATEMFKEALTDILCELWDVAVNQVKEKDSGAGVLAFLAEDSSASASGNSNGSKEKKKYVEKPWSPPVLENQILANAQERALANHRNFGLLHQVALHLILRPWQRLCCRRRPAPESQM